MKVGEVGLLLRRLYGYNSVSFLKPVTPLRISCYYERTRHLTKTKGRNLDETEAPPLKVWMRG